MFCTNVECKIKTKKAQADGNEYGYIEFGRENVFFVPCSMKTFDTINAGFHTKLSVGKSKEGNPKIVYTQDDKNLYMLIKTDPNQDLYISESDLLKIEMVKSVNYFEDDEVYYVILLKILGDVMLVLVDNTNIKYISIKNKYIDYIDDASGVSADLVPLSVLS